jgi:LysM repeat protein
MMGGTVFGVLVLLLLAHLAPAGAADSDEVLLIPVPGTEDLSAGLKPAPQDIKVLSRITIREGDSLWRIARRTFGMGIYYPYLLAINAIENPDLIYYGRSLFLPAGTLDRHPALASRLSGKTATIVFPPPAASSQAEPKAALPDRARQGSAPSSRKLHEKKSKARPATTQKPDTGEEAEVQTIVEMASRGDCPGVIAAADRYLARHARSSHRATILLHQAECYRLMLHSGQ